MVRQPGGRTTPHPTSMRTLSMSIMVRCLPLGCSPSAPDGTCHDPRVERTRRGASAFREMWLGSVALKEWHPRERKLATQRVQPTPRCAAASARGRYSRGGSTQAKRLAASPLPGLPPRDFCNGASNQMSMLIRKGAATLLGCKLALCSGNKHRGQRHNRAQLAAFFLGTKFTSDLVSY